MGDLMVYLYITMVAFMSSAQRGTKVETHSNQDGIVIYTETKGGNGEGVQLSPNLLS